MIGLLYPPKLRTFYLLRTWAAIGHLDLEPAGPELLLASTSVVQIEALGDRRDMGLSDLLVEEVKAGR